MKAKVYVQSGQNTILLVKLLEISLRKIGIFLRDNPSFLFLFINIVEGGQKA